eukprot:396924_1
MSTNFSSKLHHIKSEPIVILEATPIKAKSTSSTEDQSTLSNNQSKMKNKSKMKSKYHNGTQSLHTTPIENDEIKEDQHLPAPMQQLSGLSISVSVGNINTSHAHRHRHSKKHKTENTTREAGHTPPPRFSQNNISRFSDLVHDTDKKEGPINWWNLKVKMPDDNTMNILSPHRIPVPQTPTTPEYIVKTPDGLRISLLDVDIDDEKKLSELGIQVDDEKKK